jgi:hypothetical protein
MDEFKNVDTHISEINDLLSNFDSKFNEIVRNMKKMNVCSTQNDLKKYRKIWKENFNKEIINKDNKKKIKFKLEFEDKELLENPFGMKIADIPKNAFNKKDSKPKNEMATVSIKSRTSQSSKPQTPNLPENEAHKKMKSKILSNQKNMTDDEMNFIFENVLPSDSTKLKLLYRLSKNSGFSAEKFHRTCDKEKNTIFICETDNGSKFGAVNYLTWGPESVDKKTDKNCIFSISNKTVHPLMENESGEFKGTRFSKFAIKYDKKNGPMMGESDLIISNNCHKDKNCSSDFDTYEFNLEDDTDSYLAGSEMFSLKSFFIYKFS